ncbi:DUF1249 domain-containing protein [Porticoccaceae bacterium]|nr:DUF1249 domain-containing protein [Porticoccaceae bacterium]MDB4000962.1 DUF1249 domain-containing protein [bacterium]MDB4076535.1 DUF1249 domain-containing protein [Porticoccaceae bacterium]MDB4262717.1 DUF1249 domain-containing protein [Porticoccaceae bacterium]MDB4309066.1 DUF1249 domain-containing protein [Porticoccaceae bacterium]
MSVFETRKRNLDLMRLHEECERNYQRLQLAMPDSRILGASTRLHYRDQPQNGMRVEIIEVTKYTSTLLIVADNTGPEWLPEIEIKVRVYRDARMAEVIEWCSDRTIPWALSEQKGMQARDEKWQWNMFLSELLSQGLRHGITELEV